MTTKRGKILHNYLGSGANFLATSYFREPDGCIFEGVFGGRTDETDHWTGSFNIMENNMSWTRHREYMD